MAFYILGHFRIICSINSFALLGIIFFLNNVVVFASSYPMWEVLSLFVEQSIYVLRPYSSTFFFAKAELMMTALFTILLMCILNHLDSYWHYWLLLGRHLYFISVCIVADLLLTTFQFVVSIRSTFLKINPASSDVSVVLPGHFKWWSANTGVGLEAQALQYINFS
jgi:hypothetical protein